MQRTISTEIANSTPLASAAVELILNVFRSAAHLHEETRALLAPAHLQPEEYNILRILRGAGTAGHTKKTIGERMLQYPDRLAASLHRLKQRDLVTGIFPVRITEAGVALLAELDGVLEEAFKEKMSHIPKQEIQSAISVLERTRSG